MAYYLGIDFGTSGARAIVIDQDRQICLQVSLTFGQASYANLSTHWQEFLASLLSKIGLEIRQQIRAIAINGTSSTVLLCDSQGKAIAEPLFYNDSRGKSCLDQIQQIAPANHVVNSSTSSLAKLLWYQQQDYWQEEKYFLHQADWLGFLLHGKLGVSDYHNALKLGYDPQLLTYPNWLQQQSFYPLLPEVFAPGTPIKEVTPEISDRFGFPSDCLVCTGTTDSIAAFIASGANQPGEAVTSLGSTLVLKLLSKTPVSASQYGIYSHRFQDLWLTGGASNTGGAVLKYFFSDPQLKQLSAQIDPTQLSDLDYYPLLEHGERFPVNDPNLAPRLEPRPKSDSDFLAGLLTSMARIEAQGYAKLQKLGASKLIKVYTAGGGAQNNTWTKIRQNQLQLPVLVASETQAAYGTALLAMQGSHS